MARDKRHGQGRVPDSLTTRLRFGLETTKSFGDALAPLSASAEGFGTAASRYSTSPVRKVLRHLRGKPMPRAMSGYFFPTATGGLRSSSIRPRPACAQDPVTGSPRMSSTLTAQLIVDEGFGEEGPEAHA